MASSAREFIDRVVSLVRDSGGEITLSPRTRTLPGDRLGVLRGRAMYDRGFQLHFMTVVGTSSAAPILRKYKFHLMADNGQGVFRYDDTPHYPDVRTFPHHKHVGPDETVVESGPLDIEAIIAEIRQHIGDSDRL